MADTLSVISTSSRGEVNSCKNISLEADTRERVYHCMAGEGCFTVYIGVCQYSREVALSWRRGSASYMTVAAPCAQCAAEGRRATSERGMLSGIYARASLVTHCKKP
ncbi:unnamed protein product [Spodoptera exigua]|nr:unnamed protein product [Spodoptera exigua]